MVIWINLGSLIFGIAALLLPIIALATIGAGRKHRAALFGLSSAVACGIALCLQLAGIQHRVTTQDWSALMDTSGAVVLVGALLIAVTALLNILALAVHFRSQSKAA